MFAVFGNGYIDFLQDPESEKFVYQQMALTASGVSFAWSRFNAEEVLSNDQIVIQAHDEFQALNDSGEVRLFACLFVVKKQQKYFTTVFG